MQKASIIPLANGFSVSGVVCFASVCALRKEGEALLSMANSVEYEIELGRAHSEDASIFSLLLCWLRCAKKKRLSLRFKGASSDLIRMQQLFGLEKVWVLSC